MVIIAFQLKFCITGVMKGKVAFSLTFVFSFTCF